jgi:hypothetical protein
MGLASYLTYVESQQRNHIEALKDRVMKSNLPVPAPALVHWNVQNGFSDLPG